MILMMIILIKIFFFKLSCSWVVFAAESTILVFAYFQFDKNNFKVDVLEIRSENCHWKLVKKKRFDSFFILSDERWKEFYRNLRNYFTICDYLSQRSKCYVWYLFKGKLYICLIRISLYKDYVCVFWLLPWYLDINTSRPPGANILRLINIP